ncbi:2-amino-4-hydroxy-6-hydroxymethyldihydropteridine diphosphokinase [Gordonia jinhuaensis]|uniref:2-amino-4-hydroxy-6-hydroxymethyldihydropteridine diphosphokinase n=1 Tax=Gordonia jinhuaensis TaxID=1517702 RepID=A0A916TCD1_9ACTN|nr:2-amino-4-hydroxy-6-hydroxymethyldihydropteridine diphosphokinase [Gordonia jinhuaensis]GGB39569.1 2-amino-4-hydroxy-6-hydroxymethyldihydropteridine diphosphokinase [Gordonia jinhuaensis]
MSRAVLSIGSNIGDRLGHLQSVYRYFADTGDAGTSVVGISAVYVTSPWGGVDQQDFLNTVLIVDDPGRDAWAWLRAGQELERAADRHREVRWGPRTLDVDVVSVDVDGHAVVQDDPELTLPHPHAAERAFVLIPWADADSDATLPTRSAPVRVVDLIAELPDTERTGVRRSDAVWGPMVAVPGETR